MNLEHRSFLWTTIYSAGLSRGQSAVSAALQADAGLKQVDLRFYPTCQLCQGKGHQADDSLECPSCRGEGYTRTPRG